MSAGAAQNQIRASCPVRHLAGAVDARKTGQPLLAQLRGARSRPAAERTDDPRFAPTGAVNRGQPSPSLRRKRRWHLGPLAPRLVIKRLHRATLPRPYRASIRYI
jgi:hypothetical protein